MLLHTPFKIVKNVNCELYLWFTFDLHLSANLRHITPESSDSRISFNAYPWAYCPLLYSAFRDHPGCHQTSVWWADSVMCLCHYCLFDTPLDLVAQEHHHFRLTSSLMSLHIKGYVSLGILWTSAELVLQLLCWTTSSHPFLAAGQATLHGYSELRNMILKLDMSMVLG